MIIGSISSLQWSYMIVGSISSFQWSYMIVGSISGLQWSYMIVGSIYAWSRDYFTVAIYFLGWGYIPSLTKICHFLLYVYLISYVLHHYKIWTVLISPLYFLDGPPIMISSKNEENIKSWWLSLITGRLSLMRHDAMMVWELTLT